MKRHVALGLALGMTALPALALADNAKPRGGGSSSPGVRGHSGGSRPPSSSGGRYRTPSSGAERRHPRAGYGSGARGHYYGHYRYPYYGYYPYYGGYYGPYYAWGAWPYYDFYAGFGYGYPYGFGVGYHGGGYGNGDSGEVRVLVDPESTRVYVDGYYAGVADDFDGMFQRLHVPPGRHELTLRLEGYRSHRVKVYVPYDGTLKLHHDMVRGEGESFEDLVGPGMPPDEERWARRRDPAYQSDEGRPGPPREGAELRLTVRPEDASVYIDGEFRGSGRQVGTLRLEPGRHRIEAVRPGYRTFDQEVEVAPDRPTDVTVELARP